MKSHFASRQVYAFHLIFMRPLQVPLQVYSRKETIRVSLPVQS